ncbi:Rz1-like lysis system protein LysC [Proteus terrae]|uniref:Rz1-like lysis system protein LysC n=1 Tax=Proteus terrae TaxID=1574161 RepID=UPI003EC1064B
MILSGCTTKPPTTQNVPYQENLLTKCTTTLPKLKGNTGADLATALLEYVEIYGKCAVRHNQLTDEIRQRMEQ